MSIQESTLSNWCWKPQGYLVNNNSIFLHCDWFIDFYQLTMICKHFLQKQTLSLCLCASCWLEQANNSQSTGTKFRWDTWICFFFNAEAYYEMAYKICYFLTPHSFLSRSLVVYPSLPWLGRRAEAPHPAMELIWVPKNTSLHRKAIGNL